jgi:protein TonB
VQKDGAVTVQRAVEGDPIFYAAAIDAVRQWRYEPTFLNGQPIDMDMTIAVTFVLNH